MHFFRIILGDLLRCGEFLSAAFRRNPLCSDNLPKALFQRLLTICSAVLTIKLFTAWKTTNLLLCSFVGEIYFPFTFSLLLSSGTFFWLDRSCAWGCPGKSNWQLSVFGFLDRLQISKRFLQHKSRRNFLDTVLDSWPAWRLQLLK